jgi:hypothetical protein
MHLSPTFLADERGKLAQLWVTSIAGTALVIVIQAFGADWSTWRINTAAADWSFMLDRLIRYAFAFWFGIYMVLAYLANEARPNWTKSGLFFDVAQSVLVFIALGMLGFVTQDFTSFGEDFKPPLYSTFGAILFIAGWTLVSHWPKKGGDTKLASFQRPLQFVRGGVAAVAVIALVFVWRHDAAAVAADGSGLGWILVFALALLAGLYCYAVAAFQTDSFRHAQIAVNDAHVAKAVKALKDVGEALDSAATSLKSMQVK